MMVIASPIVESQEKSVNIYVSGFFFVRNLTGFSNRSAERCMAAVRYRGARQGSLLSWM